MNSKKELSPLKKMLLKIIFFPFILLAFVLGDLVYCPNKNNRHIGPDGKYYPNLIFGPKGKPLVKPPPPWKAK